ncbi:MAG: GNAT family N-acetyltransferase [Acidimicrobiales bacterium]
MADVTVRRATVEDAEAIGELTATAYRVHVEGDYLDELRDAASRIRDGEVLVALIGEQVVGAVTLAVPGGPYSEISRDDELEVRMLAVAEPARGQGIAARLMDAAEARARGGGFRGVVLSTAPTMHAAHRLYERRGYDRDQERDWAPEDDLRLLVYRLDLS